MNTPHRSRQAPLAAGILALLAAAASPAPAHADFIVDLTNPGYTRVIEGGLGFTFLNYTVSALAGNEKVNVTNITPTFRYVSGDGDDAVLSVALFDPLGAKGATLDPNVPAASTRSFGVRVDYSTTDAEAPPPDSGLWQVSVTVDFLGANSGKVDHATQTSFFEVVDTPEPSTLAGAALAALFGLGYAWRRRRTG